MVFCKKELFEKIGLVISSIIFTLLSMEVAFRIINPIKFKYLINGTTKTWSKSLRCEVFRPSKTLGYEFIPNLNLPEWPAKTNSFGMLDKERNKEKPKDVYRIICLGDSTTADSGYVNILDGLLNKDNKKYKFEVWNCGVSGYGAVQYYRALKEKWIRYNPDMVIVGFCLNDFQTTPLIFKEGDHLEGYFPKRELFPKVNPFFLRYSALYRFIFIKLISLKSNCDVVLHNQVGSYLQEMKESLSAANINFLIVILGLSQRNDNWATHWKTYYKEIKGITKDYNINSVDTVPIFENSDPESLKRFPGDEIHFNQEGSKIIANAIYNYLKDL